MNTSLIQIDQKDQILKTLRYFHSENTLFELCGIGFKDNKNTLWEGWNKGEKGIVSGWFIDHERAAEIALQLDREAKPNGIYILLPKNWTGE